MTTNTAEPLAADDPIATWLMDGDPAIRWQVLRDLLDAPPDQVAAERARVATDGWGAQLLAQQADDGQWADGACFPGTADFAAATARARAAGEPPPPFPAPPDPPVEGQPWTATYPVLLDLAQLGVPSDSAAMRRTAPLVEHNCRWEYDGSAFFDGETDCCINAGTIVIGELLDRDVEGVVRRLLDDQLPDGGWNCWAETPDAPSSFASTLDVVAALLTWEGSHGEWSELARVRRARAAGEEYLLHRHLFRSRRSGAVVDDEWLRFAFPPRWHYDVLKAADYFARRGGAPDPRLAEAIEVIRERRQPDGRWLLDRLHPGPVHVQFEEPGEPSRWNTLRALRVLRWFDDARRAEGVR